MATVSLAETKEHLRIRSADTTQDVVLAIYMDAADDWIANFLNQCPFQQTSAIKAAALLIIGDLFENREGGSEKEIKENPAVCNLLYPYRINMGM